MKRVFYFLVILFIIVLAKFFVSSYDITYKVDKFKVREVAKDGSMFFVITYKGEDYKYKIYENRKFFKKRVSSVKVKEEDSKVCVTPVIKGYSSYTICSVDGVKEHDYVGSIQVSDEFNDDFHFNENLRDNEFVYIWKYDGFYFLNGKNRESINIFNKDRYSNDMMFQVNDKLIFPSYDDEYLFSDFIVLDMTSGEYFKIKSDFSISYTSKIVGNFKNSVYIFDSKDNVLYEVNYKKKRVLVVGSKAKGYIGIKDGKKRDVKLTDYTKNNLTYFDLPVKDIEVKGNVYSYLDNDFIKYFSYQDVRYIDSFNENIYFLYEDNLYRKDYDSVSLIVHNFEFNFNSNDLIYVYNR